MSGSAIDGSTITFTGVQTFRGPVSQGRFELSMSPGQYAVDIDGPGHVAHRTDIVQISAGQDYDFTVLGTGVERFGAIPDEAFYRFFHQVARVGSSEIINIHKWVVPPSEILLIEGTVPQPQFEDVRSVVEELNQESLPALWCGFAPGPLTVSTSPEAEGANGRIVVAPNWDEGSSATGGIAGEIRAGLVRVNVFRPGDERLHTRDELKGIILHEFYHVAFGHHLCGGNLGPNPFGFSPGNCPFPDSVMANLGDLVNELSPQDRLAACIVYNDDTHIGNRFPDINTRYTDQ